MLSWGFPLITYIGNITILQIYSPKKVSGRSLGAFIMRHFIWVRDARLASCPWNDHWHEFENRTFWLWCAYLRMADGGDTGFIFSYFVMAAQDTLFSLLNIDDCRIALFLWNTCICVSILDIFEWLYSCTDCWIGHIWTCCISEQCNGFLIFNRKSIDFSFQQKKTL